MLNRVCFCVCLDLFGYPTLPCLIRLLHGTARGVLLSGGQATSTTLIFYWQGGFICLINSLFLCVMCFRKEESRSCGIVHCRLTVDCVCGVSCVSGCKCEKGVYSSAETLGEPHSERLHTHSNLLLSQWIVALQKLRGTQEVTQRLCRQFRVECCWEYSTTHHRSKALLLWWITKLQT